MLKIDRKSFHWALNHALNFGDTDVFPEIFEFKAINENSDDVLKFLENLDLDTWKIRPARTLLSPKAKYGFRVITQIDPLDFLIYSALIYELTIDLETKRIPTSEKRVFSYRIKTLDNGQLFDPNINYRSFLAECRKKVNLQRKKEKFVVTTDISDFYSRIYHHRLENALNASTVKSNHVRCILKLLSAWNGTESYGIPVGSAPSRVLAEINLIDVDEALLARNIDFIRYNDDYRIFAKDKSVAYQHLSYLAEILQKNHGLSLQQHKTHIFKESEFNRIFLTTPLDKELHSLHTKFSKLLEELNIDDEYQEIEYSDLSDDQRKTIDSINLIELFVENLKKSEPDIPVLRFCLNRLGQLGDPSLIDKIFENLESTIPIFKYIINYFSNLRHLSNKDKSKLGKRILSLLENSIISGSEYHRMLIISLFIENSDWNNESKFLNFYNSETSSACRRKWILAMGRAKQTHWFQSNWRTLFDFPHWPRRAILYATSCLSEDARKHYYKSIEPQLDILEKSVVKYAKKNPFT